MKVGVDLQGLTEVRKRLKAFSTKEAKSAVYGALDEVAHSATTKLARRFDRDIEGGPVKFSEVRPGQRRSSVVEGRARRDGAGGVASEIRVQAKQAKYLRFVLGEDDTRTPGEAGFGPKFNMVPVGTAHQIRKFRVEKDKHGNLTRASYRRLYREAFSQRRKDLETLRKRDGRDPTKEEFDAFRGQRKADRKLRRVDARVGTTKKQSIFFGRLGKKKTLGFWNRPPDRSQNPTLVVLALQRTRYKREYLVPAWNDSVREAMEELPRTVQRRLSDALAKRSG